MKTPGQSPPEQHRRAAAGVVLVVLAAFAFSMLRGYLNLAGKT